MLWLYAYRGQGVEGGDLNTIGPHSLLGSGTTIRRCGPAGVGVTLLEEACQWGLILKSHAQARPSVTLSSSCLLIPM